MLTGTVFLDAIETAAGSQEFIVGVSQQLPWFGKRRLRGDVAGAQAEALWYEAERVRLSIIEQTRDAYYDHACLAGAHKALKTLEPKVTSLVNVTRAKFRTEQDEKKKIGYETVLQAEVELYRLRTQLAEIEEAQKRALARLKELIGHPQHQPLSVAVSSQTGNVPKKVEPLLALVDHCQPELLARMRDSQRDAAGMKLAKKNYFPDFTIGGDGIASKARRIASNRKSPRSTPTPSPPNGFVRSSKPTSSNEPDARSICRCKAGDKTGSSSSASSATTRTLSALK